MDLQPSDTVIAETGGRREPSWSPLVLPGSPPVPVRVHRPQDLPPAGLLVWAHGGTASRCGCSARRAPSTATCCVPTVPFSGCSRGLCAGRARPTIERTTDEPSTRAP